MANKNPVLVHPIHKPTPESHAKVKEAAGRGLPQTHICTLVGLSDKSTLIKYYRQELDEGIAEAAMVATGALLMLTRHLCQACFLRHGEFHSSKTRLIFP